MLSNSDTTSSNSAGNTTTRHAASSYNAFEVHGITHLSPSQINTFIASPALWVMEKLFKLERRPSLSMHAGTSAELGVARGLINDASNDECVESALAKFRSLSAFATNADERDKYIAAIPRMVVLALSVLRTRRGKPITQGKLEIRVDGLAVPVIGYFDFLWADDGELIDLKTTLRMPSQMKLPHARQLAFYKHGVSDNLAAAICYVTDKRIETYPLMDSHLQLQTLERAALTMQRFVALSRDKHELAGLVMPDYEHFYWNDDVARAHGGTVWGV